LTEQPRRIAIQNPQMSRRAGEHPGIATEPYSEYGRRRHVIELAVVIPTFNECDNIRPLLARFADTLDGVRWEAVFVDDDSSDGTAELLHQLARADPRLRVIRRIGRRGLSSACVEGILSTSTDYFAVIDADLQHDESLLPRMLDRLKQERLDLVVASRYVVGGSVGEWGNQRRLISRMAGRAARLVTKADITDPMSGFFVMRRDVFDVVMRNLSQSGFKILLDVFASAPRPLRFAELPYHFRQREHGESKLDSMVAWEYGMLLIDKLFGRTIPPRFFLFGVVGGLGLVVHMLTLGFVFHLGAPMATSQSVAVLTAMTFNFVLNNLFTYRDRRLQGWRFLRGLLSFYAVCSLGAVANVGVASLAYAREPIWWVAGLAGAVVGAAWNYAASSYFTWRR
jgi:dolichol-phosphate mannosyltransferase